MTRTADETNSEIARLMGKALWAGELHATAVAYVAPRLSRWRLWLHRRFFFERHFWVKRAHRDIPSEQWCFECGTVKGHVYPCRVENAQRMMMCDPSGDYLNCLEVLEAFLFVGFTAAETYTVCAWCEDQVRRPL